jgi:hypothetical protein
MSQSNGSNILEFAVGNEQVNEEPQDSLWPGLNQKWVVQNTGCTYRLFYVSQRTSLFNG